jgi:solute carrier family 13 (sodium-dependent dicarboxylate transporter), member 2/3/5
MDRTVLSSILFIGAPLLLCEVISSFYPHFPDLKMLSLLATMLLFWFTEIVPLQISCLFIPILGVFYGLLDANKAFETFSNPIVFLIISSLLFVKVFQKYELDKKFIKKYLFSGGSQSLEKIIVKVTLASWLVGMWISNTVTCAVMLPVVLGLITIVEGCLTDKKSIQSFSRRILLVCAVTPSIGGMVTPVGSLPNLIAIDVLAKNGREVDFVHWIIKSFPLSAILLFCSYILLKILFPLRTKCLIDVHTVKSECRVSNIHQVEETHSANDAQTFSRIDYTILCIFFLTIFFWIFPGFSHYFFSDEIVHILKTKLIPGVSGIFFVLLFTVIPEGDLPQKTQKNIRFEDKDDSENKKFYRRILNWEDIREVDFSPIIIFAGGLLLGEIFNKSAFTTVLIHDFFKSISFPAVGTIMLVIACSILLSELISNTATAAIMLPLTLRLIESSDPSIVQSAVIAATFACGFGFMVPVSTPPNALVYGTGKVPLKYLLISGSIFDLIGGLIIFVYVILLRTQ